MIKIEYPPLESISKPTLTTKEAAHYMNRKEQTLRIWACDGKGAVLPIKVHGRLAWRVSDIKAALGVE